MNLGIATQRVLPFGLVLWMVTGCANEFVVHHSGSGDALLISRRAYTPDSCIERIKEDGVRMGITFRYIHVRGSVAGRSLLWPFERGFACEAAIGPEQLPAGAYPLGYRMPLSGS
jgi:hypothetical protein